ncbi:Zn-ribbon domain-containing OB-fold protein [Streptomyces sp. NPDC055105]|uniref:Zn-ribbon domain-containing OB-fold protein n=1 Tax=Streptomyces sp. NPDC055105 TaxID=3365719 RepID=UPI0037D1F166
MSETATHTAPIGHAVSHTAPTGPDGTGLTIQRCRWCGTASFRRLLCPVCASSDLQAEYSDGLGVVVQSSVVNRYTGTARNESLVRFPEGFVFRCRVVGAAPNLVWIGARVRPVVGSDPDAGEVVFELCDTGGRTDWQ